MQKSDPTLSNVSNKPEFSQSSFSNLIIVCVYWYKPTKNSFANKNLAFSVCVMFNKTIHSNTTERDTPFSIPFSFCNSLIIQDAQQCNGSRVVVTLSVPRNRGSQLDAPVAKSSCWTAPKRKVMVVSVTDIFMRQVKLMELLSSPAPNAEFQQKAHGSHLNLPSTSAWSAESGW